MLDFIVLLIRVFIGAIDILYIKCCESPLLTLAFLCINSFIRVFEDINKVFKKDIEIAFKTLKRASFYG